MELPISASEEKSGQHSPHCDLEAFFALSALYVISGKVERIQSVSRLRDIANPSKAVELGQMVETIDHELQAWHRTHGRHLVHEDTGLWVVATFLYSAITLNLHRCVLSYHAIRLANT